MPTWLTPFTLELQLGYWQQLGLAFLLGSFAVATLSDLKYLAAQREFLEVWIGFLVLAVILEGIGVQRGRVGMTYLSLKWVLIVALSVLSWRGVGVLFRLAIGDVFALAAAASLLTPGLVVVFFGVAKILSLVLARPLSRGRKVYPFMPVVSLATLAVLALGLALGNLGR